VLVVKTITAWRYITRLQSKKHPGVVMLIIYRFESPFYAMHSSHSLTLLVGTSMVITFRNLIVNPNPMHWKEHCPENILQVSIPRTVLTFLATSWSILQSLKQPPSSPATYAIIHYKSWSSFKINPNFYTSLTQHYPSVWHKPTWYMQPWPNSQMLLV
jgi:hypothetical protein